VVLSNLAEHEYAIGYFYMRFGIPRAAAERFEYLLSTYPQYKERDKVIYRLGLAYQGNHQPEEARKTFDILRKEFPQSAYIHQIPDVKGNDKPAEKTVPAGDKAGQ
jgi:outer membrane protein assembly factor BamD (BamD/ComL family)